MEKLRKALDRARQERGEAPVQDHAAHRAPEPANARPVGGSEGAPYSYSRTRVFEPDLALLERNRILAPGATTLAADAFRMLRTQVSQRMEKHGWRTLAICSPRRGDGRTLAAVNLAVTLAADPRYSVLLCDLDLKTPTIARLFGVEPQAGVDDVLAGKAAVEDCLVHPVGFDRLVVLPARAALAGSSEYLAGEVTRELVAELRARYPDRILIFDLPPVLAADDALAFSPNAECALVVIEEGATRRDDVTRCLEILQNLPVVGTVLNQSISGKVSAV